MTTRAGGQLNREHFDETLGRIHSFAESLMYDKRRTVTRLGGIICVRTCPMIAHQAYTSSRQHGWTRIDMIIALYQATLNSMEQLESQLADGRPLPATQMKLQRRLLGILAGLDLSAGDLPMQIGQLVRWALSQLPTPDPQVWRQVIRSFRTICQAYESIRPEAAEQELAS